MGSLERRVQQAGSSEGPNLLLETPRGRARRVFYFKITQYSEA